jgi:hypothetical protein
MISIESWFYRNDVSAFSNRSFINRTSAKYLARVMTMFEYRLDAQLHFEKKNVAMVLNVADINPVREKIPHVGSHHRFVGATLRLVTLRSGLAREKYVTEEWAGAVTMCRAGRVFEGSWRYKNIVVFV